MSEKVLKFLLSELTTVRIRCKNSKGCSGVIEMSMENFGQLGQLKQKLRCPVCTLPFTGPLQTGLETLGHAIVFVKSQEIVEHFQVEFVLPDSDEAGK